MKKKIINIMSVICMMVALGCAFYLGYYYISSAKNERNITKLSTFIQEDIDKNQRVESEGSKQLVAHNEDGIQRKFETLFQMNSDFVGWIQIKDTHIDYPVMQTVNDMENGQFYIHRDFEQKNSAAGLPFVDANCDIKLPTDNIIVYGHNMNAGTMFHDLLKYEEEDFYKEHKRFSFDTIYEDAEYEVVAMFYAEILDDASTEFKYYEFVNAGTEEEFMDFVDHIKEMSIIDTGVDVKYGDKLITLSTCAYHVEDGRFAVIAKKIEK